MRYGMIVCSANKLVDGGKNIRPLTLKTLSSRWSEALGQNNLKNYGFGWKGQSTPIIFRSPLANEVDVKLADGAQIPTRGNIVHALDRLTIKPEDEMFFYYYGHAYPSGGHDITLCLHDAKLGDTHTFRGLITEFYKAGFRRIYFALDTCHAGRQDEILAEYKSHLYGVFASGNGDYAISEGDIGALTDSLLRNLDFSGINGGDNRLERAKGGVTIARWFKTAIKQVRSDQMSTPPKPFGELVADAILFQYQATIPQHLNDHAPAKSIYRKLHAILVECGRNGEWGGFAALYRGLKSNPMFTLREGGPDGRAFVQPGRIREMLEFLSALNLVKLKWERGKDFYSLTSEGKVAADVERYNKQLLNAIENHILPVGVTLERLHAVTVALMNEARVPNTYNVIEIFKTDGYRVGSEKALKNAFLILPYTQKFRKVTTDTIFPYIDGH
ncbi:MAG: hypothetical protein ABSD74_17120 [Rhizomicrobium sp.]|jgi:hypothetical protein